MTTAHSADGVNPPPRERSMWPTKARELSGEHLGGTLELTPPKERTVEGRLTQVQHQRPYGRNEDVQVFIYMQALDGRWTWMGHVDGDTDIEFGWQS